MVLAARVTFKRRDSGNAPSGRWSVFRLQMVRSRGTMLVARFAMAQPLNTGRCHDMRAPAVAKSHAYHTPSSCVVDVHFQFSRDTSNKNFMGDTDGCVTACPSAFQFFLLFFVLCFLFFFAGPPPARVLSLGRAACKRDFNCATLAGERGKFWGHAGAHQFFSSLSCRPVRRFLWAYVVRGAQGVVF